ncbi:MAG TPA: GNAT family N-acetyltransferase [Vicinamibacterales bacterium]|jgi:GNAT superfamily N-acetyltransferase|nr:GNAT family N-acetyltransferase [Vicinamibacterales bacterium]
MANKSQPAVRTYLELRDPGELHPARIDDLPVRVERVEECPPSFWRFLYSEVGRRYHWVDRLGWTDQDILNYLHDPSVSLWLLTVAGAPAGYFELRRDPDDAFEVAYFGLLKEFTGRGFGAYLLTEAVERAWALGATRVWLHTSTLDHPAALPNYLKRGFQVFRTEEYAV